jgi:hypothetical protein
MGKDPETIFVRVKRKGGISGVWLNGGRYVCPSLQGVLVFEGLKK